MKKLTVKVLALAALAGTCGVDGAAEEAIADSLVNNYMRSSIYTIVLNSKEMNDYFEKETKEAMKGDDPLMAGIKSFTKTDEKRAANETEGSIFELPARMFPTLAIPNQFNDHNLAYRVINFDSIRALCSDDEIAKHSTFKASKTTAFGKFAKAAAGMSTKGNENNEVFDKSCGAVLNRFFNDKQIAANIIGKWFDYDANNAQHWANLGNTVHNRASYNFTEADIKKAETDHAMKAKIEATGFDMIDHTFVLATNLRFRSYQAVVNEAAAAANAVGGMLGFGGLTTSVAKMGASAAAGDGYTIQAVTNLYKLKWNQDIATKIGEKIAANASLEDLINDGLCELEFVGREKSQAQIRQSKFNTRPFSELVQRGVVRAIDASIANLQGKHEVFRTAMPIIGGDGNGAIYAAIGTKEGLGEKDEYEILEANEDENGKVTYKSVGTVKPVKGKIWDNAYGSDEEIGEDKDASAEAKEAVSRGYSEFKGKKGDFTGYYLRLKKKGK